TTENSHSWVEVLFPDYGWLAFEPTPERNNPVAAAYLAPRAPESCGPRADCEPGERAGYGSRTPALPRQLLIRERSGVGSRRVPGRAGADLEPRPAGIPYGLVVRVLLAVAAALLLLVPVAKALARRRLLLRVREPRGLILATYRVFAGQAADLGMARGEGETLREYCRRVQAGVGFSDGHLDLLTGIAARAAYSPRPMTDEEAHEAVRAARTAIRDMRRDTKLVRRLAGIYRPGW
ncbi:MAG: transglutaminase domain-containing protein, partial [Actinobacteria bacterium]|nr:transglutaminase domain-containing protein [Actinomycetota bacterium]